MILGTNPSTHSSHLEKWLGAETVQRMSANMKGWYGPPIALHGVPGNVRVSGDGDFIGKLRTSYAPTALDRLIRFWERVKRGFRNAALKQQYKLHTGFASLGDLISEATNGKRYDFQFSKVGPTGVANSSHTLWRVGNQPSAGLTPAAAPGGLACVDSTAGGFPYTNPSGSDTLHFVSGFPMGTVAGNTLLLYDRIFHVAKTINSSATEAVTGVPTRYQSQTGTNADYIGGNFLFMETGVTALANTAHNHTVCTYTDQGGAASTLPSLAGNPGGVATIADRLDMPTNSWFAPLEAGDVGVKALTQMQTSALVATGTLYFVIGHPIAWMPCPIANLICVVDGINTAFNLIRIFDDACLAFLEVIKPSTTATTYNGTFTAVAG